MSDLFELTDHHDRRLARRSDGVLRVFNEAGVLTAADVHVASRLGVLGGETDERVLLAVALTTRAVRHGSVCLEPTGAADIAPELDWPEPQAWVAAIEASPLVTSGVLRWEFGLLQLDRYWRQETAVVADLRARAGLPAPDVDEALLEQALPRLFPRSGYDEQVAAVRRAVRQRTTVLTGGPGTGKTTTVAGLLAALSEQAEASGKEIRIALAAPTGKAAARLQESVRHEAAGFDAVDRDRLQGLSASTLHRLLGSRRDNGTRFRHHRANRLPHDVVVVDEASMVSLTMMARLLEAVRTDARLVIVGDPDQLASVDAGAVLGDLVGGWPDEELVVALRTNHRSTKRIIELAEALKADDPQRVLDVLADGVTADSDEVDHVADDDPAPLLRDRVVAAALKVRAAAESGDAAGALAALDEHRLLCAHREGPFGVRHWNRQVEAWLSEATGDPLYESWYVGRPVLVTANDYALGLHNGDTGVVVRRPSDGARRVVFESPNGVLDLAPSRLDEVETMHAMTIHKSQGSQAHEVTVLLPDEESRLLTRELFYTAVTRAQRKVRVVGGESAVRAAVTRRAVRASGLRPRLEQPATDG